MSPLCSSAAFQLDVEADALLVCSDSAVDIVTMTVIRVEQKMTHFLGCAEQVFNESLKNFGQSPSNHFGAMIQTPHRSTRPLEWRPPSGLHKQTRIASDLARVCHVDAGYHSNSRVHQFGFCFTCIASIQIRSLEQLCSKQCQLLSQRWLE